MTLSSQINIFEIDTLRAVVVVELCNLFLGKLLKNVHF